MPNDHLPHNADQLPPQATVYTPLPRKSNVFSKANMLMAGLFVAALVGLYLIHASSGPNTASAQTLDIDRKLVEFLKDFRERDGRQLELVDTDQYDIRLRQVSPEDLATDPFRYKLTETVPTGDGAPTAGPSEEEILLAKLKADALTRVEKVKVQTIMLGVTVPFVLIDGSTYNIGDTVASDWSLVEILRYEIKLQWKNDPKVTYFVALEEEK
jgi:hypothetical protein